ncbi:energy transducer TonB [Croceimicrobium sp.]|uniref:energy transducer TonB n=1 Tax=Croceimicrobium sp. TaxID=2828340 RepID=UPI003BAC9C51
MQNKKNPKIDLEKYRTHFLLAGVALSLFIVIQLFNINFSEPEIEKPEQIVVDGDDIVIPITVRPPKTVKVEQPKELPSELNVVDDNTVVDNELDMSATETDEDEYLISENQDVRYVEGEVEIVGEEAEDLEELEDPIPFAVVETVPIFPGCESFETNDERKTCFQTQLLQYVSQNFVYSETARRLKIEGRVIVSFVVEKNGQVSNVQVLRSVDPYLDNEAIRVISGLPQIEPAKQRGKAVRMSFVVPIKIELKE